MLSCTLAYVAELIVVKIPLDFSIPESCTDLVDQLAHTVYAHGNDNQKGQAMLCTVYFRCARLQGLGCSVSDAFWGLLWPGWCIGGTAHFLSKCNFFFLSVTFFFPSVGASGTIFMAHETLC